VEAQCARTVGSFQGGGQDGQVVDGSEEGLVVRGQEEKAMTLLAGARRSAQTMDVLLPVRRSPHLQHERHVLVVHAWTYDARHAK
jgi:hypothetical protein